MKFEQGAGFRVCGSVVRRWANQAGTYATLVLDVFVVDEERGRSANKKLDFRGFRGAVTDIAVLTPGAMVEVTGSVDSEKLTNKAKEDVMVDGYPVWVTKLTVRAVKVESSSRAPASNAPPPTSGTPAERSRQLQEQIPANPAGDQGDPTNW